MENATDRYFDYVHRHGRVDQMHAATVSTDLMQPQVVAPGLSAANDPHFLTEPERIAIAEMRKCPIFGQLDHNDHHDQEIIHAINDTLHHVLRHNKAMYVPADEIMKLVHEIAHHVEEFKSQRSANPGLPVAHLHMKIGRNSLLVKKFQRHFEAHHPDQRETFEPGGHRQCHCPHTTVSPHGAECCMAFETPAHHYGYPINH